MKHLVRIARNEDEFGKGLFAVLWVHEVDIKKLLEIMRRCGGYMQVDYDYADERAEEPEDE